MADAMLNMMDNMGMFGRESGNSGAAAAGGFGQPWQSATQGFGSPPWTTSGPTPGAWGANNWDPRNWWNQAAPGVPPAPTTQSPLAGAWISRTGERLWIGAGRFRLESAGKQHIDGVVQFRDKLLALYSSEHNRSWIYEYAEHQGRLALRDTRGRIYLYRRTDTLGPGQPDRRSPDPFDPGG